MPAIHDDAAERYVLDCVLSAPAQSLPVVRSLLTADAFYRRSHGAVYAACLDLSDHGQVIDPWLVATRLEQRGAPDNGLTWQATVADLLGAAPLHVNAGRYALQVAELAQQRRVALLARSLSDEPADAALAQQLALVLAEPPAAASGQAAFALALDDFIADRAQLPAPLIGDDDDVLLPAAGLLIEFAKGGRGKTTLTIDLAFHAASGLDWLGFEIRRPLRVLFVENEGPRESFRAKLERKRRTWRHDLAGALYVHSLSWGALTLADPLHVAQLRRFVREHEIDVVVGDPLDSLGLAGVGSPEDTRQFMALLASVGLFRDVAFILLAHPRKEITSDELDEIAGAWGGRPDTMLRLAKQPQNRARLSFPKFRWSRRSEHPALILAFDPDTDAFALVAVEHESVVERDYVGEIRALLERNPWRTAKEISQTPDKGGIGANVDVVRALLENPTGVFVRQPGKLVGRHPTAICWHVTNSGDSGLGVTPSHLPPEQEGE